MNDPARTTLAILISHWPTIGGDTHDPAATVRIEGWLRAIRQTNQHQWQTIAQLLIDTHPRRHPPGIADWQAAARTIAARHQLEKPPPTTTRPTNHDTHQRGIAMARQALAEANRRRNQGD